MILVRDSKFTYGYNGPFAYNTIVRLSVITLPHPHTKFPNNL